ncbi:hypothetical protein [Parasphingorhabdus sp.]|uniref:hypothetical protein n=1 Tax=Parasphingorhabdus sp. TaxID=2709688 RepID=UPI0035934A56
MTDKKSPPPATISEKTGLDAHGHEPEAYDWVPVLRKRRKDGWTPERQRAFIGALADSGQVVAAARSVGMSDTAAYTLRRAPGAEGFAAAWEVALDAASRRLVDIAFDRAINGVDDIVLDRDGRHVYTKRKYNDRLLMFLIRAHAPGRYDHRGAGEGQDAVTARPPVAEALKLLGPEPPDEPDKRMPPDELEDALEIADLMDGKLPHWHRQDPVGDPFAGDSFERPVRLDVSKLQISDGDDEKDESWGQARH